MTFLSLSMAAWSSPRRPGRPHATPWLLALFIFFLGGLTSQAQVVTPDSISITQPSPVCSEGSELHALCIELPPSSIVEEVDVFFLFDDTGSFASFVPTVATIFSELAADLGAALPDVDFGFGVGRFEDYGGPGYGFSSDIASARPFILNQPIVTAADAGGSVVRDALITAALVATAPGAGGDGPETAVAEGLFQVATGLGFDGDGDAATTGDGGLQAAGAAATQLTPDTSGDVPAFATLEPGVVSSGSVGGAGFRAGALKLTILATDICSVAAFDSAVGIPTFIDATGGAEPVTEFACALTTPGAVRFGFVADALSFPLNTIAGAVVPKGAGTVPASIAALNSAGIRVLGMGPDAEPKPSGSGPHGDESVVLSALARMTGAVDESGVPLVFDIGLGGEPLKDAIVAVIELSATLPIDISLVAGGVLPADLSIDILPDLSEDVAPGDIACFDVYFTGTDTPVSSFPLDFLEAASGAILGSVPVDVDCEAMASDGRMNGGGSVFAASGARVTHGFTLHCDTTDGPNWLQVNWGGNRFHLESLNSAFCSDDTELEPATPAADFDTYVGTGTGRLNGLSGAVASWRFTDAGEPGVNDVAEIVIQNEAGAEVLSVSGTLRRGNHQAHGER